MSKCPSVLKYVARDHASSQFSFICVFCLSCSLLTDADAWPVVSSYTVSNVKIRVKLKAKTNGVTQLVDLFMPPQRFIPDYFFFWHDKWMNLLRSLAEVITLRTFDLWKGTNKNDVFVLLERKSHKMSDANAKLDLCLLYLSNVKVEVKTTLTLRPYIAGTNSNP